MKFAARGRTGGGPGALGRVSLASGEVLKPKGLQVVPAGDRLVIEMPGGGGLGDPRDRDPAAIARDVRLGYISQKQAAAHPPPMPRAPDDALADA